MRNRGAAWFGLLLVSGFSVYSVATNLYGTKISWNTIPDGLDLATAGTEVSGGGSAGDTVWVFSDYQCPACRQVWDWIREERTRGSNGLHIRLIHHPHISAASKVAADAADCLGSTSSLVAYSDQVFALTSRLDSASVVRIASEVDGRSVAQFVNCMESQGAERSGPGRVLHRELGADGTPVVATKTGFVNHFHPGMKSEIRHAASLRRQRP